MSTTVVVSLSPLLSTTTTALDGGTLTFQNHSEPTVKPPSGIGSLKSCKKITELKQLHAQITKQGLVCEPSSLTNLVASCAEMATPEALEYAEKAFELFNYNERTLDILFMFNSLIRGYSFAGLCDKAILLYVAMVGQGVEPNNYTFPFVLSACAKFEALQEGEQVHGSVVKLGFEEDVFVQNSLIHFYCECGEIVLGRKVFDEMSERNVVSWTSLICGYARRDQSREAVSLFFEMVSEGIKPNSVTMVCVISACAKLRNMDLGERVCTYIGESGLKVNTVLVNALVDMYMKCGAYDNAKRLFSECFDKNLILYNTILSDYVHNGLEREALDVLDDMLRHGLKPDKVTMLSAVSISAELGDFLFGKHCHGYVLRNGLEGWENVSNAIIDMYMKCGKWELASRVFDRMPNKTLVSWNTMIGGLMKNGDVKLALRLFKDMPESDIVSWNTVIGGLVQESMFEDAIELFRVMQSERIEADSVTMVSIALACGYLGALVLAKWTYRYIEKKRIHCDMRLNTALVDMFARCGDSKNAMKVFNRMEERDVSAWTAAIGAMAMEGNGIGAIGLFEEMLKKGLKPDEVVFVELLMACSHGGLVEQGMKLFCLMKETHEISPQIVHFGCVVDLLGRAGLLSEALDLIKTMPMEPNDVVWGAFLAACRSYKNEKMAKYAAERMTEAARGRSGTHVLLSNIYASTGKLTNVARVRLNMKEKGVRKVPGSSLIEVNGSIHEFTSGDESSIEMNCIGLMLQEINLRLRDAGHVPDLTNVLLDVGDQEKEFLLSRHSEKIAVAFGLIGTGHGVPIRVIKNLRMCSDCHNFAKLVSKIYNREIVIRDNNRFHFFQQGLCSCNDYW